MAHQRTQPATPDLFSTELARNDASPQGSTGRETAYGVSQRHVLPRDLPNAVKYLTDTELDLLIATAVDEAKRRGRLPPKVEPKPPDEPKRTRVDLAMGALTRGQVNAARAAYKAGVTPSQIARQFGISQSNIRSEGNVDGHHNKKGEIRVRRVAARKVGLEGCNDCDNHTQMDSAHRLDAIDRRLGRHVGSDFSA